MLTHAALLQLAIKAGVTVCLATGKARPAALAALTPVGLAGVNDRHCLPCSLAPTSYLNILPLEWLNKVTRNSAFCIDAWQCVL